MARLIDTMMGDVFYEEPKRPKTEVFSYEHRLDPYELEATRHRNDFKVWLKRRMANELAEHIIDKCQLFRMPDMRDLERGIPIRMELTINDRGTFENARYAIEDAAKRQGVKTGIESVKKSMPYGFELDQYYE